MKRHVVLVGLSGSGKTVAGEIAARELGAPFADIDSQVEQGLGKPISQIFTEDGEAVFREAERAAVNRALQGRPGVVAPGGGWAAQGWARQGGGGAKLHTIANGSSNVFIIYLRTDPSEASRRLTGSRDRPLLAGDREADLVAQLKVREPFYLKAEAVLDTDGLPPAAVGAGIAALARKSAGW